MMMIFGSATNHAKQKNLVFKAERNMKGLEPAPADTAMSRLEEEMKNVSKQNKLSAIINKMRMGKRLSNTEKDYLKKNAPDAYNRYRMVEAERNAHRKQLDRAKSKKDAAKIQQTKMAFILEDCKRSTTAEAREHNICRAGAIREEYREYREDKAKGKKRRPEAMPEAEDTLRLSRKAHAAAWKSAFSGKPEQGPSGKAPEALTAAGRRKAVAKYRAASKRTQD